MDPRLRSRLMDAGAAARRAGASWNENPGYRAEQHPSRTGEPLDAWHARLDAWSDGWRIEDAIRTTWLPPARNRTMR